MPPPISTSSRTGFNFPPELHISPSAPSTSTSSAEPDTWQADAIAEYGIAGRIWEASYLLNQYLQPPFSPTYNPTFKPPCSLFSSFSSCRPQTILELGSGTGHTSLLLASLLPSTALVVLTDLPEVVPLMEARAVAHRQTLLRLGKPPGAEVLVRGLAWGEDAESSLSLPEGRKPDAVLCSDLVYFPFLYPPLLKTLLALTNGDGARGTEVVIAFKVRSLFKETPFWDMLGEHFTLTPVLATRKVPVMKKGGEKGEEEEEEEEREERFGASEGLGIFVCTRREAGRSREEEVGFEELLFLGMEV